MRMRHERDLPKSRLRLPGSGPIVRIRTGGRCERGQKARKEEKKRTEGNRGNTESREALCFLCCLLFKSLQRLGHRRASDREGEAAEPLPSGTWLGRSLALPFLTLHQNIPASEKSWPPPPPRPSKWT